MSFLPIKNRFRSGLLILPLFVLLFGLSSALKATPDTVKVGVFVTSIFDFSLSDRSYSVDFWMWLHYRNDSLNLLESTEISNSKEYTYLLSDIETTNGINWATQKCKAIIKKEWDVTNFPFDRQVLTIELEESILDTSELVYLADTANSRFDRRISVDGWKITHFSISAAEKNYRTTYGDPHLSGESTYASAEVIFHFSRDGISMFFKLFTGIYVAFFISVLVFFMGPENPERFGVLVGTLFAGIGNKYVVDSLLPETTAYTLVDKVHTLAFIMIFLALAATVIAYRLDYNGKRKTGWLVDKISFSLIMSLFVGLNIWFFVQALGGS